MPIQIVGADGATVAAIDATYQAQRVSLRPVQVNAWTSYASPTGLVTTLAAAAPVFSLRYTGTGVLMVRRVQVQWITTTTFTTAQRVEFGLYVARGFSTADSGGLPLSVASGKHRTTLVAPNVEARVSMTTALTAGTRTLDSHPLGIAAVFSGAVGATMALAPLFSHDAGDHPLVLANQEGFVIANLLLMGAGGAGVLYVNCEIAEASGY